MTGPELKRFRRKVLFMTQEEFADRLGLSIHEVRKIEQGRKPMTRDVVRGLALLRIVQKLKPRKSKLSTYVRGLAEEGLRG